MNANAEPDNRNQSVAAASWATTDHRIARIVSDADAFALVYQERDHQARAWREVAPEPAELLRRIADLDDALRIMRIRRENLRRIIAGAGAAVGGDTLRDAFEAGEI